MAMVTMVYDSMFDEFADDWLFVNVKGKPNITVAGFTADGDVFGGFYTVAVSKQDEYFKEPTIFAFSFEWHGRSATLQRQTLKKVRVTGLMRSSSRTALVGSLSILMAVMAGSGSETRSQARSA